MKLFNKENKKNKTKRKPFFGISHKASILVVGFVVISFATALAASVAAHTLIAISANVIGDRQLGRTMAITIDQDTAVRIYEEGSRIYYSLSEEEKADPTASTYLSRYTQLKDEDYLALQAQLKRLADTNTLKWIDLRIIDKENNRFVFLMDTEDRMDLRYAMGAWEYTDEAVPTFLSDDTTREAEEDENTEIDIDVVASIGSQGSLDDDHVFCTIAPFYHPDTGEVIGYIGIGEENALITEDVYSFVVFYILIAVLFVIIIVLISRVFFRWLIVKPVKQLTKAAQRYSDIDDKLHSEPIFANLKIKTHDEIRTLADSMKDMELDLASYMENLTTLTATHERIEAELGVAESIQTSMLPEALTGYEGVRDFEISSYMKTAREVGGDFYDYFVIDDDHIGLSIADVSGKGVPAALFMAICKTLLKNAAMEEPDPAKVIEQVNRRLCENNPEIMFVTVWFGIYTVSTHTIDYVNAGHEYPALYRALNGRYELVIEDHDLVLGFDPDLKFTRHSMTLEEGDKLFLYTDGIPEATSASDELYGTDRMTDCLNVITAEGDCGSVIFDDLISDIENFISGADQFDDMTMLLIERTE